MNIIFFIFNLRQDRSSPLFIEAKSV